MKRLFLLFTSATLTFFLIFSSSQLFAQAKGADSARPHSFPPLEAAFTPQAEPGTLSGEGLLQAALDCSLVPRESPASLQTLAAYRELEKLVCAPDFLSLPAENRAEQVLTLMYEKVLRRYSLQQSQMDELFRTGSYNCVSSSALYGALASACGLQVRGNLTKDHAFCTVYLTDDRGAAKKIDVETTNPNGFNPGTRKMLETRGGGTAYYIVPKKSYQGRVEVSLPMLVSAIARNLASDSNNREDYRTAIPLALARFPFAQSPEERQSVRLDFDMVAANYALTLDKGGRSEAAIVWLESVYERYGETPYLAENYNIVAYNALAAFINNEAYSQADTFLKKHQARMSKKTVSQLETVIFIAATDREIQALAAENPDQALERLALARGDSRAQAAEAKKRLAELFEYCWFQKLKALFDRKDYMACASLADQALKDLPQSQNLRNLKRQALQNHGIVIHNQFALLANAGKYEEALAVLEQGLQENPENSTLKADLQKLRRQLGR